MNAELEFHYYAAKAADAAFTIQLRRQFGPNYVAARYATDKNLYDAKTRLASAAKIQADNALHEITEQHRRELVARVAPKGWDSVEGGARK